MKRIAIIFILITLVFSSGAQMIFKTIVPQGPIVAGESFQVQYIIEDVGKVNNFIPPDFKGFQMVAGPNIYSGSMMTYNQVKQLTNTVYTLLPIYPGRYIISGAVVNVKGKNIRSNDVVVEVISKEEAMRRTRKNDIAENSEYLLHPGEDPYEKIKKNLFLKVMVDKKNCFVGEPVLAVFKLYSRLESKSDIVKNPGFYGFTVYDMVNLADKQSSSEVINGKLFDVHTIRKVQLYPLQEGRYTIDAMEVKNSVEFSHSVVNKKTEQEIVEGVLGSNTVTAPDEGAEVFETTISTGPVEIKVKPVPVKNKPMAYNGATGSFFITTTLEKDKLAKNEEGDMIITITGKGNFTQLAAPVVQWPEGIEGFEPLITDSLNKMQSPLTGSRIFRYAFVGNKPGNYELPAVAISYFDPAGDVYKTVASKTLQFTIANAEKISIPIVKEEEKKEKKRNESYWLIAGGGLLICLAGLFLLMQKRKKKPIVKKEETRIAEKQSIKQLLAPANFLLEAGDKIFYSSLNECIWNYFQSYFHLSGSEMNKDILRRKLKEKQVSPGNINEILEILQHCETSMFTNAALDNNKQELLERTTTVLEQINA